MLYFILSCTGYDWVHEEGLVLIHSGSGGVLSGSQQHLSACRMCCFHNCWYSGEIRLHQKAVSSGTWMVCEESVNLGYTCHHLAKNHLYSHVLSISTKRLYGTVILHVVLYRFIIWFFTLRENIDWRHFRVEYWERYLGLRRWKKLETGGNCIMRSCMICAPHKMLYRWDGQPM